jgi:hypothetical protein
MQANRDPMTGAWRWLDTLGKGMADVPAALIEDLLKLRRIYPDVEQMVSQPVTLRKDASAD